MRFSERVADRFAPTMPAIAGFVRIKLRAERINPKFINEFRVASNFANERRRKENCSPPRDCSQQFFIWPRSLSPFSSTSCSCSFASSAASRGGNFCAFCISQPRKEETTRASLWLPFAARVQLSAATLLLRYVSATWPRSLAESRARPLETGNGFKSPSRAIRSAKVSPATRASERARNANWQRRRFTILRREETERERREGERWFPRGAGKGR